MHSAALRIAIALVCATVACTSIKEVQQPKTGLPPVEREFRAAWVATVANINWPSRPGLPVDSQKLEAIKLLDFLRQHHFNAVILQVRPQADALYPSDLEPWSYFLTGKQGEPPVPFYDPLQFWIDQSHRRGIELHVWLNPYRAHHVSGGVVTEHSMVKKKPGLVHFLKEGYWWFDPSRKETREHSTAVVMDIVKRYDIDGVHFDDYFYPYPSYNKNEDFPDSASWQQYQASGGKLSRGDWRRNAVNEFIRELYAAIRKEKKHVKFGLSPFGIWRPGYPPSISGFDQHNVLYADARLWLNEGWIDYFSPQLYWPISRIAQSFPVLLGWWSEENKKGRHLWPGMSVGRDTSVRSVNETTNQIMITRGMLPKSPGAIHWSISPVMQNVNLQKALLSGPYQKQALVPASPWLDAVSPAMPDLNAGSVQKDHNWQLNWNHGDPDDVSQWVLYSQYGETWKYQIFPKEERFTAIPAFNTEASGRRRYLRSVALMAVDRTGNTSEPRIVSVDTTYSTEARLYPGIIPRAAWNASEPRAYPSHKPVRITVHHEGTKLTKADDAAKKIFNIQRWGMGPDRNWADIPYHFLIAPDGKIYEGRNVSTVGETATEYDPSGHLLICCLGNLEEQDVPVEQLNALISLIAYASARYEIPLDSLATHRDYSKQTTCPGKKLYQFFQDGSIRRSAEALLKEKN